MSAAVAIAVAIAAAIPGATGDKPGTLGYAIEFPGPSVVHLYQPFTRSAAPKAPARLAGRPPWRCEETARRITCSMNTTTSRLNVVAIYRATRRESSIVVSIGPRAGGGR